MASHGRTIIRIIKYRTDLHTSIKDDAVLISDDIKQEQLSVSLVTSERKECLVICPHLPSGDEVSYQRYWKV